MHLLTSRLPADFGECHRKALQPSSPEQSGLSRPLLLSGNICNLRCLTADADPRALAHLQR